MVAMVQLMMVKRSSNATFKQENLHRCTAYVTGRPAEIIAEIEFGLTELFMITNKSSFAHNNSFLMYSHRVLKMISLAN